MKHRTLLAAALLALAGCGGGGDSGGDGDNGDASNNPSPNPNPSGDPTLTLRLTDAAGDLDHAWVDITGVTLEGEDDNGQPVSATVFSGATGNIDLLTLDGTTTDVVVDATLPDASYNRMRMDFANVVLETLDGQVIALAGSTHPGGAPVDVLLECPSCIQGNPNVKLPGFDLDFDSGARTLVLDFDVNQSFGRWPGEPGRWLFRPAIYAVDESAQGSIAGTVTLDTGVALPATCGGQPVTLESFTILAFDAGDAARSARTTANGSYRMDYVVPGRYGMRYAATVEFADQVLTFNAVNPSSGFPIQVVVDAGATATMDYLINFARCDDRPAVPASVDTLM